MKYRWQSVLVMFIAILTLVITNTADMSGRSLYEMYKDAMDKGKVFYCTNKDSMLTPEEMEKIDETFVKSIDIKNDTVKVSLKGLSISDLQKKLQPAYRADLRVGSIHCRYENDEIPTYIPKTSQYMVSDSCFYLTFDLAPRFQTKGDKMAFSMFMVLDSLPRNEAVYPISPVKDVTGDSTIIEWHSGMSNIFTLQLAIMPGRLTDQHITDATILNGGTVKIHDFKIARSGLASVKMDISTRAIINSVSDTIAINGTINLKQIQPTDLHPCLFEIDYSWGGYLDNAY